MATEELLPPIPDPEELFLRTPMYERFSIASAGAQNYVKGLANDCLRLDCYCQKCQSQSVFQSDGKAPGEKTALYFKNIELFARSFSCARDSDHKIFFLFWLEKDVFIKIGQQPSFAELAHPELDKYRSIMAKADHAEFTRAIGLAAHGIGIGAFVYMRRIFERLVEEAHLSALKNSDWKEDDYQRSRMVEKIELLQLYLPTFLVENRALYSIMSKGIHELSENECKSHFDAVRVGIELILDEKEADRQKRLKVEGAKKAIQQATQKLA